MDNNNSKKLLETLSEVGVCKTGRRYLKTTPKDMNTLIKVWKRWPEYLCEHSEFAIKLVRQFVDEETKKELISNNLFVDFSGPVNLESDTAVFFIGASEAVVTVKDFAVVKIYLFNDAKIKVIGGSMAFVSVEAYNNSVVTAEAANDAKISVYQYDNSTVTGSVNIHKKEYVRVEVFNGKEMPGYDARL